MVLEGGRQISLQRPATYCEVTQLAEQTVGLSPLFYGRIFPHCVSPNHISPMYP